MTKYGVRDRGGEYKIHLQYNSAGLTDKICLQADELRRLFTTLQDACSNSL